MRLLVSWFLETWMKLNLIAILIVALQMVTGAAMDTWAELVGVFVAAISLYAIMMKEIGSLIVMSMVIITSQLTGAYLPSWLNDHFDWSVQTGYTLSLFVPVIAVWLLSFASKSPLLASILLTIIECWFVIVFFNVFTSWDDWYFTAAVCCVGDTCPFEFDALEISIWIAVVLFRLLIVFLFALKRLKEERRQQNILDAHHRQEEECKRKAMMSREEATLHTQDRDADAADEMQHLLE